MANYEEAKVQLTNTHLNKLKFVAKNNTGTILRTKKKDLENWHMKYI